MKVICDLLSIPFSILNKTRFSLFRHKKKVRFSECRKELKFVKKKVLINFFTKNQKIVIKRKT